VDLAALYLLERICRDVDGAWWHEKLDLSAISAPRGVIFRARLPEWVAYEVDWREAPDAEEEEDW